MQALPPGSGRFSLQAYTGFFMRLTRPDRTGIWITIYQPAAQGAEVRD